MNTTAYRRVARFAGLLLLALLVFAVVIQTALARNVGGSGAGSGNASFPSTTQLQGSTAANAAQHDQGSLLAATAATAPAGAQGTGGVAVAYLTPMQPQGLTAAQRHHYFRGSSSGRFRPLADVLAARTASFGTSPSRTAWIAGGLAAAIALLGFAAWALTPRRRQPEARASAAYCAQHPDDALCRRLN